MLGKQASDERFYLKREKGGRGLKPLRDMIHMIQIDWT